MRICILSLSLTQLATVFLSNNHYIFYLQHCWSRTCDKSWESNYSDKSVVVAIWNPCASNRGRDSLRNHPSLRELRATAIQIVYTVTNLLSPVRAIRRDDRLAGASGTKGERWWIGCNSHPLGAPPEGSWRVPMYAPGPIRHLHTYVTFARTRFRGCAAT